MSVVVAGIGGEDSSSLLDEANDKKMDDPVSVSSNDDDVKVSDRVLGNEDK